MSFVEAQLCNVSQKVHRNSFTNSYLTPYLRIPVKSRIRETLNLLTCSDSSTDTKTDRNKQKVRGKRKRPNVMCHVSHVTCHISCVMCNMSCVKCLMFHVASHLSPVTNTNSHSHRAYPC